MLIFTVIFVFIKLITLQGITQKKFAAAPIWLFHVDGIETQNDVCFAILLILIWGLENKSQPNKGTVVLGVETPTSH